MKKTFFLTSILFLGFVGLVKAQQFTYQPISPFFGGTNAFNYQQILSSANAQNSIQDPSALSADTRTELERFADNVNTQIFSQLSLSLIHI